MRSATLCLVLATLLASSLASPAPLSLGGLTTGVDNLLGDVKKVVGGVAKGVEEKVDSALDSVGNTVDDVLQFVGGLLSKVSDLVKNLLDDLLKDLSADIEELEAQEGCPPDLLKLLKEAVANIVAIKKKLLANSVKLVKAVKAGDKKLIRKLKEEILDNFEDLKRAKGNFKDVAKQLKEKKIEKILKIVEKLESTLEKILEKAKVIVKNIVELIRKVLGSEEVQEKVKLVKEILRKLEALIKKAIAEVKRILEEKGVSEKVIKTLFKLIEKVKRLFERMMQRGNDLCDRLVNGDNFEEIVNEIVEILVKLPESVNILMEHIRENEELATIMQHYNYMPEMLKNTGEFGEVLVDLLVKSGSTVEVDVQFLDDSFVKARELDVSITVSS